MGRERQAVLFLKGRSQSHEERETSGSVSRGRNQSHEERETSGFVSKGGEPEA